MTEYEQGALMAVSILMATHDQPVMAADVLKEMGLHDADVSDFDEYDKRNLRRVQGELGGHICLRGL
jgi:hypothetical protein